MGSFLVFLCVFTVFCLVNFYVEGAERPVIARLRGAKRPSGGNTAAIDPRAQSARLRGLCGRIGGRIFQMKLALRLAFF